MTSRHLPFSSLRPNESGVPLVMDASFVCVSREVAEAAFAAPWDAMRAVYQMAYDQTMAALRPRRSVLDIRPSWN